MMIRKVSSGLEIALSPDDCVVLARACRHAADKTQELCTDDPQPYRNRSDSSLFSLMACTLDAYILVTDAENRLGPQEREGWDLGTIRKEWSPLVWDGGGK